jgi:hypothetical protein
MHLKYIEEMVHALKPVLNDKAKAERILNRYWQAKMALVWTVQDAHRAANEIEYALTETEARELLRDVHAHHNPQYGLQWRALTDRIREDVLGRRMTEREVNRFVKKNILTIQS